MGQLHTPIISENLNTAQALLSQNGPGAMYNYLSGFGDRYSTLALGVVDGNTLSGQAAIEFMERTAESQGRELTEVDLDHIRMEMAQKYLNTLNGIASNPTNLAGVVDREITAQEAQIFHDQVFQDQQLGEDAWTLNTPFNLFGEQRAQEYWDSVLASAGDPVKEAALSYFTYLYMEYGNYEVTQEFQLEIDYWLDRVLNIDGITDLFAAGFLQFSGPATLWLTDFLEWFDPLGIMDPTINANFNAALLWTAPRRDPLVLDLDGDGIETVAVNGNTLFDQNTDGIKTGTGWVNADDGILVLDRNSNGTIDNGGELFGDQTVKTDGTIATDGFDALADMDSNGDNVVDASDAAFADLRIWRDLNQDGVSQANELFTLEQAGVASISVEAVDHADTATAGGMTTHTGSFTRTDGTTGTAANLDLDSNGFYREFTDVVEVPAEIAALPNMQGSGMARDLREAAAQSTRLAGILEEYAVATTRDEQLSMIDDFLDAWADSAQFEDWIERLNTTSVGSTYLRFGIGGTTEETEAFTAITTQDTTSSSTTESGMGEYLPSGSDLHVGQYDDAVLETLAKIRVLEIFNASEFFSFDQTEPSGSTNSFISVRTGSTRGSFSYSRGMSGPVTISQKAFNFSPEQMAFIGSSYDQLKSSVYDALLSQTRLKPAFDSIHLTIDESGALGLDFTGFTAVLTAGLESDQTEGVRDFLDIIRIHGAALSEKGWNGYAVLLGALEGRTLTEETEALLIGLNVDLVDSSTTTYSVKGQDHTTLGNTHDNTIAGTSGVDRIYGHSGDDVLNGLSGNDVLDGGSGNDVLDGSHGADILIGGLGDDQLNGGAGSDTYVIAADGSHDVIKDLSSSGSDVDRIVLAEGIRPDDISFRRSASDLVLEINIRDTVTTVTISNAFADLRYLIDVVEFSDGGQLSMDTILSETKGTSGDDSLHGTSLFNSMFGYDGNDTLMGSSEEDTLNGGNGDDVLIGGAGNDIMDGGHGNDRYEFNLGDGQDTISHYDPYSATTYTDTLAFGEGISLTDLSLVKTGNNLIIQVGNSGDQLILTNWFSSASYQLDRFELASGETYTAAELLSSLPILSEVTGSDNNDSLTGYYGADFMSGGAGGDTLSGQAGDDVLDGGDGIDTLHGGDGNDQLLGGAGDDRLNGNNGDDLLVGGAGNDVMDGGHGNDRYEFSLGDGQDTINQYDPYSATTYTDTLAFGEGISLTDLSLVKTGNNLIIQVGNNGDQLTLTNWFSSASYQLDRFELANGEMYTAAELLNSLPVLSKVAGAASNDTLVGYHGVDIMSGGAGNDTLTGHAGDDILDGGDGIDTLHGGDGNDQLLGGAGDDRLNGNNGDDLLVGGAGNDVMDGGHGNDRYEFSLGDGQDTINQYDPYSATTYTDTLAFGEGISLTDLSLVKTGNNLIIQVGNNGDQLTLTNWFSSASYQLDRFELANGEMYTAAELLNSLPVLSKVAGAASNDTLVGYHGVDIMSGGAGNDTLTGHAGDDILDGGDGIDTLHGGDGNDQLLGGAGDDRLNGNNGDDLLVGGAGNDVMDGGHGNDRYEFSLGDGQDTINQYDPYSATTYTDTLAFGEGISLTDLSLVKTGNNLIIQVGNNGDQLTLTNWFSSASYQLDRFELANGEMYTAAELLNSLPVLSKVAGAASNDTLVGYHGVDIMSGGAGNDTLTGHAGDDILDGGDGIDTLHGGDGNDQLLGGAGDDRLNGNNGDDLLVGGAGNDIMDGGHGSDRYQFSLGDGQDTINQYDPYSATTYTDTLAFGEGISLTDLSLVKTGNNLIIQVGNNGDQLTLTNWFSSASYQLDRFELANGEMYTAAELLNSLPVLSEVAGAASNDTLVGYHGVDIMSGGAGNDTLTGHAGDDILDGGDGIDTLHGGDGNDRLLGDAGDDRLNGNNGDDVLIGGAGNDIMDGGHGNDRYEFSLGDGQDTINQYDPYSATTYTDTLAFGEGISLTDLSLVKTGNNLIIQVGSDGDQLTLTNWFSSASYQLDRFELASGETYTAAELLSTLPVLSEVTGSDNNDSLTGYYGADFMSGGAGSDTLSGQAGDDVLDGGDGIDTLHGGDGNDQLLGGAGDDRLNGNNGDDLLVGGAGNDIMDGGHGSDRYQFSLGDGQDTINQYDPYSATTYTDTLAFGEGISLTDLSLVKTGNNLIIQVGNDGDQLTLTNWFSSASYQLDRFELANGQAYTAAEFLSRLPIVSQGSAANDTLSGHSGDDVLDGADGNDALHGGYGNDLLLGGTGDDALNGSSGNDVLVGGAGNDILDGGNGNDRYEFNLGDGQDTINQLDSYSATTYTDTLAFGEGISLDNLGLVKSGSNLIVQVGNDGDQLTLTNWFSSASYQLDRFELANGEAYTAAEFLSRLPIVSQGSAANDTLSGHSGDDVLDGADGNDALHGGYGNDVLLGGTGDDVLNGSSGNDVLVGGAGNDILDGGNGNDRYEFNLGDGQDTINQLDSYSATTYTDTLAFGEGISLDNLGLVKSGSNLIVQVGNDGDQLTLTNWFSSASYQLDRFELANGEAYTAAEFLSRLPIVSEGSAGNDTLSGHSGDDVLEGNDGNDTLHGGSGNDQLLGGAGDDALNGSSGNDVLVGGAGNDTLDGGHGNDTYRFGRGDGQDTVNNYDTAGFDQLDFGGDISNEELWFSRSGNNLIVTLAGTDDQVQINNWYSGANYQVDEFEAGDHSLDRANVETLVSAMASFEVPGAGEIITSEMQEQLRPVIAANWQSV